MFCQIQNNLVYYLQEYKRIYQVQEEIQVIQAEYERLQNNYKQIGETLEYSRREVEEKQSIADGFEQEYRELVAKYNQLIKANRQFKTEVKKLSSKVKEQPSGMTLYEQDKRFDKSHDMYQNKDLYRLVLQKLMPYKDKKRWPSQVLILQLKQNQIVQDFLATKRIKLAAKAFESIGLKKYIFQISNRKILSGLLEVMGIEEQHGLFKNDRRDR